MDANDRRSLSSEVTAEAIRLLRSTDLTVGQIAKQVGASLAWAYGLKEKHFPERQRAGKLAPPDDADGCRTCTRCKLKKPFSEYRARSDSAGGLSRTCRACDAETGRSLRESAERRHDPANVVPEKKCSKCKLLKPASEFRPKKTATGGLRSRCRSCEIDDTREMKYGIDRREFDALMKAQGGRCAICKRPFSGVGAKQTHVDHDHVTGRVRGLLCYTCNVGIGYFNDSVAMLEHAIAYLKKDSP
jgi:hypothetical protein